MWRITLNKIKFLLLSLVLLIIFLSINPYPQKVLSKEEAIKIAMHLIVHNYNSNVWTIKEVKHRYHSDTSKYELEINTESPTVIEKWNIPVINHVVVIDARTGEVIDWKSDGFYPELEGN